MAANFQPESAKIYQFPPRGRLAGAAGQTQGAAFAANRALPGAAKAMFGSSWYHEEAIEEERARKD